MSEERRQKVSVGQGLLSEKQYASAVSVAKQIPCLDVSKAFFKVVGERVVTPSSLVQLVIKARFIPPGSTNIPEVNELDLEDVDPDEGDVNALLGRKTANGKTFKSVDGKGKPRNGADVQPPLTHAPYFARDHSPRWYAFLADVKQGRMAVPPFTFTTFDQPLFDDSGNPTFKMQTTSLSCYMWFVIATWALTLRGRSHFRLRTWRKLQHWQRKMRSASLMKVGLPWLFNFRSIAPLTNTLVLCLASTDWFYSTDSLAGQMQALKTGSVSGSKKKQKARKLPADEEESSEDDESDTDGDADDTSETDTETDTDAE